MHLDITRRYLHLPVRNGAPKTILRLTRAGSLLREFDIELACGVEPHWWACTDIGAWIGSQVEIALSGPGAPAAEACIADLLRQSDALPDGEDLYREPHRPQFHFTPKRGWNNDPNGLAYERGQWHLFFQHNPFGIRWGNMHWGHAVSPDLVHWREEPIALYPQSRHDMAYSGGALVDRDNLAGFGPAGTAPLIVAFTSTGRGECLAWSTDAGRTFTEIPENPVLRHRGRDPRIIRYEPEEKWVMVVYDEPEDGCWRYAFHESKDLRAWRFLSAVDGFYECPDLFELPLDGDRHRRKWVLYGAERREENGKRWVSRSSYAVGSFDGQRFHPETPILTGHLGPQFYAAQTVANAPDGRCILMGWLCGAEYPDMPFSQGLTVPLELSLRTTAAGPRLCFEPVRELRLLRQTDQESRGLSLADANRVLADVAGELLDLDLTLSGLGDGVVALDLRGIPILVDAGQGVLACRGVQAPLRRPLSDLHLRLLLDRGVLEVFADDGLVALSFGGVFASAGAGIRLSGPATLRLARLRVAELASAWQPGA